MENPNSRKRLASEVEYQPLEVKNFSDKPFFDQTSENIDALKLELIHLHRKIENGGYALFQAIVQVFYILFGIGTFVYFIKLLQIPNGRFVVTLSDLFFYGWQTYQLKLEYDSIENKDATKARKAFNLMLLFIAFFTAAQQILINLVGPRNFFSEYSVFDDNHEESAMVSSEAAIQKMRFINFLMQESLWIVFLIGSFMVKSITLEIFQANQKILSQ